MTGKNQSTQRESCPIATSSTTNIHRLTWEWTQPSKTV